MKSLNKWETGNAGLIFPPIKTDSSLEQRIYRKEARLEIRAVKR